MKIHIPIICIHSKDIAIITGKSTQYGQIVLQKIRKLLKKEKHQPITVKEYANALTVEEIMEKRHYYYDTNLQKALEESKRKGR